jgi:hypothetical protein
MPDSAASAPPAVAGGEGLPCWFDDERSTARYRSTGITCFASSFVASLLSFQCCLWLFPTWALVRLAPGNFYSGEKKIAPAVEAICAKSMA